MFNNNKPNQTEPNNSSNFPQNNRDEKTAHDDASMNVISERSEIIGTLKSRRNIKIAGKIDGGVEAEGKVIIAPTGVVEGSISSQEAYIAGKVEGDIRASEKLTLASSAVVKSDLYTPNLSIEEGAVFSGVSHMEVEKVSSDSDNWHPTEEELVDESLFEEKKEETNGEFKPET
jgi:cytoskeletal protein CcmA (bactofilin family)